MGDPDTSPRKLEETAINDQTSALITSFLKSERTKEFKDLTTPEERIKLIYKHEAYWPMLSVIRKGAGKADSKGEKDSVVSRQMRDAGNTAFTCGDDDLALHCYNQVTTGWATEISWSLPFLHVPCMK